MCTTPIQIFHPLSVFLRVCGHKKPPFYSGCLMIACSMRWSMASIHHYFVWKQVGDTQKCGKPEMRSSCRSSLDLHWSAWPPPGRGSASVPHLRYLSVSRHFKRHCSILELHFLVQVIPPWLRHKSKPSKPFFCKENVSDATSCPDVTFWSACLIVSGRFYTLRMWIGIGTNSGKFLSE